MVRPRTVRRGEIWLATLDLVVGSEIRKTRRCIVISPPEMHDHLRTAIVAPMTTKAFPASFRVPITHAGRSGLILLDQIRTVDKVRLVRRLGSVSPATLTATLATLAEIFAE
ncbi:MAG: type II toxin-antitoxin system PemK/MazF family toxin [Terracidiphilus sp.]|jgi:mRNA interferase MazF